MRRQRETLFIQLSYVYILKSIVFWRQHWQLNVLCNWVLKIYTYISVCIDSRPK